MQVTEQLDQALGCGDDVSSAAPSAPTDPSNLCFLSQFLCRGMVGVAGTLLRWCWDEMRGSPFGSASAITEAPPRK